MRGRALLAARAPRDSITDDEVYLVLVRYASTVPIPTTQVTTLCRKTYERDVGHRNVYNRLISLEHAGLARSMCWAHNESELTGALDHTPETLSPRELLARHWVITIKS